MMRAVVRGDRGTCVILGLSDENVRRVRTQPIHFRLEEVVPEWPADVFIVFVTAESRETNAWQAGLVARLTAAIGGPRPGAAHIVLAVNDEVLDHIRDHRFVKIPMPVKGWRGEFLLTRARTEHDFLEEYATMLGPNVRIEPGTL
jgi:hypothetical protein